MLRRPDILLAKIPEAVLNRVPWAIVALLALTAPPLSQAPRHAFALGTDAFMPDGTPLQIFSGEMHPARIPSQY
jgi:hypothetical protein